MNNENLTPEAPEEKEEKSSSSTRQHSVFPYLAILFGTAFLLLLFAYLMQQRESNEIIGNLSNLRESMGSIQSIDQLIEENRALREEYDGLQEEFQSLQQQVLAMDAERDSAQAKVTEEREMAEEAWNIICALDTMARVRKLYEEDRLEEAQELVLELPQIEHVDEVTYYLNVYKQKNIGIANGKLYDPLTEWQDLKNALAEETDE